jgi:hypothetical protein
MLVTKLKHMTNDLSLPLPGMKVTDEQYFISCFGNTDIF